MSMLIRHVTRTGKLLLTLLTIMIHLRILASNESKSLLAKKSISHRKWHMTVVLFVLWHADICSAHCYTRICEISRSGWIVLTVSDWTTIIWFIDIIDLQFTATQTHCITFLSIIYDTPWYHGQHASVSNNCRAVYPCRFRGRVYR